MPSLRAALLAAVLAISASPFGGPLAAQPRGGDPDGSNDSISVYLLTMGQGGPYWTRFGHNALRIVDRERGTDISYNWGLFDFDEPGFLSRFVRGDTRYWMAGFDTWAMLDVYRSENRPIDMQELAIPPDAARALRDFVEWNALPENRTYRYDYYRDNCSTRVRDAIDRALGGRLRAQTDTILTTRTYRWHTRRLLAGHIPTYVGTMLALGEPTDRPITAWDEMFIPMTMRDWIRTLRVGDGRGGAVPLVVSEARLFQGTRPPELEVPPDRVGAAGLIGFIGAVLIIGLTWLAERRSPSTARIAATVLATAWSAFAGIAGIAALGLWTATEHVFTYGNENVLQATPLSLALALLLPFTTRATARVRTVRAAVILAVAVAALSAVGFVAQLLPAMSQANGEVIALALPLHAAVAYAVWRFRLPVSRSAVT